MRDKGSRPRGRKGKSLSPENLARDFGVKAAGTRDAIRALYDVLVAHDQPEADAALARWKLLLSGACGHDVAQPSSGADALAALYGIPLDGLQPAEMLFAVHTYYALLVKLLVGEILASFHGLAKPTDRVARSGAGPQPELERLEAGAILRALDVVDFFRGDPFSWYTAAWNEPIERMARRLLGRLDQYDPNTVSLDATRSPDLIKQLHEDLFAKRTRHMLGEYYTSDWLASHVLDEAGYSGEPDARLLDPACGSGTFLVMAIRRVRAWHESNRRKRAMDPGEVCRKILANVVGFDLNPVAVLAAKANYLIAVCDLLGHAGRVEIPVFLRDSILARTENPLSDGAPFDCVVGNPPWIAWDDLPPDYREATKPLWEEYGLFSLSGSEARHGGGKKDLSMLMLYAAADRYLKPQGRLSMVVTQTLFQTKGAGDGFRRFRLRQNGTSLRVLRVDDLVDFRPFPGAANWTATITLEKGSPTTYPVPYVKWSLRNRLPARQADWDQSFRRRDCLAEPIDPKRPTSPWFVRPRGLRADWAEWIGPSAYQAHLGANTGGANGVYWVDVLGQADDGVLVRNVSARGKRRVKTVEHVIEPDLLYPLVRWADVTRYHASPAAHLLLVQDVQSRKGIDEQTMRCRYPKTFAYLSRFAAVLSSRAAYKRYQHRAAFYSMYDVGPYTIAPVKVVWRRMDRRINAAVVEQADGALLGSRPVIPQETCVLIAADSADEAHYLCAVLNSAIVGFLATSHSVRGGKGFGTPSMLDFLRLRRFQPENPQHAELAARSRAAHGAVRRGEDLGEIQRQIDRTAARLWGLRDEELELISREVDEPQPGA